MFSANGPVLLIRAEEQRVLFGFWRGQRLREIEPRLKPGGKYEMATVELREGDKIEPNIVRKLAREAAALNQSCGDPTVQPHEVFDPTAMHSRLAEKLLCKTEAARLISTRSARHTPLHLLPLACLPSFLVRSS